MAFTAGSIWDVQTGGSDASGGGFDTGVSGFPTDGAATVATGNSPVFTSASYTFVAGDVSAWVYIKTGTNWTPGWYQIASVSAGAATLSGAIGAATLATGELSTVAGCATTASPTSATWGLDYSKGTAAQFSFTDMVIDGTTNTKFTSAGFPVGKNYIGNVVNVTSGTGFTVQRVAVVSTSGTVATCDKSLGTLSSTGGNGALGGSALTIAVAMSLLVASNIIWLGAGTYTLTVALSPPAVNFVVWGWSATRGDRTTTRPLVTTSTLAATMIVTYITASMGFRGIAFSTTSGSASSCCQLNVNFPSISFDTCTFAGFANAIYGGGSSVVFLRNCAFTSCNISVYNATYLWADGCYFSSTTGTHIQQCVDMGVTNCILANTAGPAMWQNVRGFVRNCSFYNNSGVTYGCIYTTGLGQGEILIENCIIWGTGANTGLNSTTTLGQSIISCNNAIGNVSTVYSGVTPGTGDVTLSANPFTNAGSGDFSLNSTAGGGVACKALGFPGAFGGLSTTTAYPDIGAVQSLARKIIVDAGMTGGMRG